MIRSTIHVKVSCWTVRALCIAILLRGQGNGGPDACFVHIVKPASVTSERWLVEIIMLSEDGSQTGGQGDRELKLLLSCKYLAHVVAIPFAGWLVKVKVALENVSEIKVERKACYSANRSNGRDFKISFALMGGQSFRFQPHPIPSDSPFRRSHHHKP